MLSRGSSPTPWGSLAFPSPVAALQGPSPRSPRWRRSSRSCGWPPTGRSRPSTPSRSAPCSPAHTAPRLRPSVVGPAPGSSWPRCRCLASHSSHMGCTSRNYTPGKRTSRRREPASVGTRCSRTLPRAWRWASTNGHWGTSVAPWNRAPPPTWTSSGMYSELADHPGSWSVPQSRTDTLRPPPGPGPCRGPETCPSPDPSHRPPLSPRWRSRPNQPSLRLAAAGSRPVS
mmetsp:Transcript_67557/g.188503  ORF Transcript_67557/g.188503 Transcript_67557/m.188503 type:complete len:229 (+) Transcript_67557:1727-2413(+)